MKIKYRISQKGKTLSEFYLTETESPVQVCREKSLVALQAIGEPTVVEYQRYNSLISDWVTIGSRGGCL